jgi:hypothetical protein
MSPFVSLVQGCWLLLTHTRQIVAVGISGRQGYFGHGYWLETAGWEQRGPCHFLYPDEGRGLYQLEDAARFLNADQGEDHCCGSTQLPDHLREQSQCYDPFPIAKDHFLIRSDRDPSLWSGRYKKGDDPIRIPIRDYHGHRGHSLRSGRKKRPRQCRQTEWDTGRRRKVEWLHLPCSRRADHFQSRSTGSSKSQAPQPVPDPGLRRA